MRVLIAFDKFKDSLTSPAACAVAADALRELHPDWELDLCPLTDGGEGFCEILTRAAGGKVTRVPVSGPRGGAVWATLGIVALERVPAAARAVLYGNDPRLAELPAGATVAVIEMAAASGLALLPPAQRDPWHTSTHGTGQLIRSAADLGASVILLGVGGSATNDLGFGALTTLGLRLLDNEGQELDPPVPAVWPRVVRLTGGVPASLPPLRIACDVVNPLLGDNGAAAVYGPQKGLRPGDLARLDQESARLALMLCGHTRQPDVLMDMPGAGAAGGIGFGLVAAARAKLLPGFPLVAAWLGLEAKLLAADVLITGEGRFDDSSLSGKGPGALAAVALRLEKKVHIFAGAVKISAVPRPDLTLHAITPPDMELPVALGTAPANLAAAVTGAF